MVGAQAQEYYGMERDYKKPDKKDVSVKNVKCNNINVNVNGLELNTTSVPFLSKLLASDGQDGYGGANSYGSYGYGGQQSGYDNKNSFKFVCINNNNNIVATGGGGNPTEPDTTLAVTKTVTCTPNDTFPQTLFACQTIQNSISSFEIIVTGNNPNPSEFAGSNDPVIVTLGAGNYEIRERIPLVVDPTGVIITRTTSFAGDCTDVFPTNPQSTEAIGTIEAGESQICDISNDYSASFLP